MFSVFCQLACGFYREIPGFAAKREMAERV